MKIEDCPQDGAGGIERIEDVDKRENYYSGPCPGLKPQYANSQNKPTGNGDYLKNGPDPQFFKL